MCMLDRFLLGYAAHKTGFSRPVKAHIDLHVLEYPKILKDFDNLDAPYAYEPDPT